MTKEIRAKTFKSGNSVALRLPKALGIKEGVEMKVREEQGRYVVEPVDGPKRKLDADRFWGKAKDMSFSPNREFEERPSTLAARQRQQRN